MNLQDFPDGTVVKNSPANAGDRSSIPGLGRFHKLGGEGVNQACARCHNYWAHTPRAHASQQEKPPQ